MKKYILFISALIGFLSCKNTNETEKYNITNKTGGVVKELSIPENKIKRTSFPADVLELDKQMVALINDGTEPSYRKALRIADKAIRLDSMYYPAYVKKASVYAKLAKYQESINIYKYVVSELKPDYSELYTMIGMLYEKVENKNKAEEFYKKSIMKYSERISKNKDILDMVNKAHISYILDKEKGLKEIDSLIELYPQKEELPMYRVYLFIQYDHKKAISDL